MQIRTLFLSFIILSYSFLGFASELVSISGRVALQKKQLSFAQIKLFKTGEKKSTLLCTTKADCKGHFSLNFEENEGSLLYVLAQDPQHPELVVSLAFEHNSLCNSVVINEVTTVATAYALAQFIHNNSIFGSYPGLCNGVRTIQNLVDIKTGKPASVVSNQENGSTKPRSTRALQTVNTLANIISACAVSKSVCKKLFLLTAHNDCAVHTTFQAVHNIARYPFTQDNQELFSIAQKSNCFNPMLNVAPEAWLLALHFVDGGFSAPGRMAFDGCGNVWNNNNFMPPAGSLPNFPGRQVTVVNNQGEPILGSPIFSDAVFGSGYGTAVDACNNGWIGSYEGGQIAQFNTKGQLIQQIDGQNHPMGMAFDQCGNLWVANMGDPTDPLDFGSVSVFLDGDLTKQINHSNGIHKPFSLAIDEQGRCWVANSGFAPVGSVTVLKLKNNSTISVVKKDITSPALNTPIQPGLPLGLWGEFASPKTIAIDKKGNAWISSLEIDKITFIQGDTFVATDYSVDPRSRGWGMAIDGNNLIWVASFTNPPLGPLFKKPPVISVVQGKGNNLGTFLYSFSNPSLQHLTGLQLDSAGNVWVANNWSLETTPEQIIGGDGLVQFIGIATPVTTPIIGVPVKG